MSDVSNTPSSQRDYPGFPHVAGRCPCCGWKSLFLGVGGYVTCGNLDCPDPRQISEFLRAFETYTTKVTSGRA